MHLYPPFLASYYKSLPGILLYCWWECKLIQPLWRTVWTFLKKSKNRTIMLCLVAQSRPTLCDPIDCSQPGSSIHGENAPCIPLIWVENTQPTSVFSRQEYWNRLPCLPPGDLPNPGIELRSPTLQMDSLLSEPPRKPRILEWVAYPFSRGSSQPQNWTGISCIAREFFTNWAIRETQNYHITQQLHYGAYTQRKP